jgi:anti-anti-sigma factor
MMDDRPVTRHAPEGAVVRVRLFGELDLAQVAGLRRQVDAALARTGDGGCLVIDLAEVEFMDCSALGVLIRASNEAIRRSIEVQIVGETGSVARLLQVTEARRIFAAIWSKGSN